MGLNFQTCTIVNSLKDADSKGKDLFSIEPVLENGKETTALKIKRDFLFIKEYIQDIRSAEGYEPKACEATIDFSELMDSLKAEENTYCRLDVYVKYEGAEPFYGANPLHIQKGIPFWIEFTVRPSDRKNPEKIAEDIEKQIKKDHPFLIDKDIINVEREGSKLTLSGATEYQRFETINVSKFGLADNDAELVAELVKKPAKNAEEKVVKAYEASAIKEEERGLNGFGTYSHLVKDLRLPTAANYQWTHIRQAETPIIDAIYNQYIIEYCAPASNEGTQFVGHRGLSHTTHVFWVKQDLVSEWEAALAKVGFVANEASEANVESELDKE